MVLGLDMFRRLNEATEIVHSHGRGLFHERLFRASNALFGDTFHAFEVYGSRDSSHTIECDMPWPDAQRAEILQRVGELVPVEHPIFPLLLRGETRPIRLSDLITQRELARTNLYNDVFKPVDVCYQLAIPFVSDEHVGGLTINRGAKDYSNSELEAASLFSRHVLIAYETAKLLSACAERPPRRDIDRDLLRKRGLTTRECEVLTWVAEGKRNAEIAIILTLTMRTVEAHLTTAYRKLGVESRAEAILMLFRGE